MESMNEAKPDVLVMGDIVEVTIGGQRRTAEVMLRSDDGLVLLDLFDGDRPVLAPLDQLVDVVVFHPESELAAA